MAAGSRAQQEGSGAEVFGPRDDVHQLEEGLVLAPRFDADGLIPVVTTDASTGEVLMMAYMNAEALELTVRTRSAHYWSRSRRQLWHKGATSGLTQKVVELRVDCDQDSLWMRVEPAGAGNCHVGYRSCYYRAIELAPETQPFPLQQLETEKAFDAEAVYGSGAQGPSAP